MNFQVSDAIFNNIRQYLATDANGQQVGLQRFVNLINGTHVEGSNLSLRDAMRLGVLDLFVNPSASPTAGATYDGSGSPQFVTFFLNGLNPVNPRCQTSCRLGI